MRLLLDQDVYAVTARFLTELGYDVVTAADIGGSRSSDIDLLRAAHDQSRVFVTRDKDFGSLVFIRDFQAGVVFLRLSPSNIQVIHQELARVLALYSENQLKEAFVVVEAGRHRFRKLSHHPLP
jgi:predicted nuclease of predicted toxin-antitoxin system